MSEIIVEDSSPTSAALKPIPRFTRINQELAFATSTTNLAGGGATGPPPETMLGRSKRLAAEAAHLKRQNAEAASAKTAVIPPAQP